MGTGAVASILRPNRMTGLLPIGIVLDRVSYLLSKAVKVFATLLADRPDIARGFVS